MAKSVASEQQATLLKADASGMLAKMAKQLYVCRFSDRIVENDTETESYRRRKPKRKMKHRR